MEFFDKYFKLSKTIKQASQMSGFDVYYLFFPEDYDSFLLREFYERIEPNSVEEFIKEGCRLFFRTKIALLKEHVDEEKLPVSHRYRCRLDNPINGYTEIEGSPFEPPEEFYDNSLKEFVAQSDELKWGGKRSSLYVMLDDSKKQDIVAVTFSDLCSTLFGESFLGYRSEGFLKVGNLGWLGTSNHELVCLLNGERNKHYARYALSYYYYNGWSMKRPFVARKNGEDGKLILTTRAWSNDLRFLSLAGQAKAIPDYQAKKDRQLITNSVLRRSVVMEDIIGRQFEFGYASGRTAFNFSDKVMSIYRLDVKAYFAEDHRLIGSGFSYKAEIVVTPKATYELIPF